MSEHRPGSGRTRDGRPMFYDRAGKPLTTLEWAEVFERRFEEDREYHLVGSTHVGDVWISTIWDGIDHNLGEGPPAFFETVIFGEGYLFSRYGSEEAALAGHDLAVAFVESGAYAAEREADRAERK